MLFARASLKLFNSPATIRSRASLSRAFCAGLIEATVNPASERAVRAGYPVLFARASLKHNDIVGEDVRPGAVIPCFLRGPH